MGRCVCGASAAEIDADKGGYTCLQIAQKNVLRVIGVRVDKVVGCAGEGDVTAIGADSRLTGNAVRTGAVRAYGRQNGGAEKPVAHEDVAETIGVVGDEVIR